MLIVDDDDNKAQELIDFFKGASPASSIQVARSLQSGVEKLTRAHYDLVLLDMTMPTFDRTERESGGRVRAYAGIEVLRALQRRRVLAKVVVVTGFESFGEGAARLTLGELSAKLSADYPAHIAGVVFYEPASSAWQSEFLRILNEIAEEA